MKKILISTVAAAMVTTSLMAAQATGPGSSHIYAGADINGTIHSAKIQTTFWSLPASDSNITVGSANTVDGNASRFITYVPDIALGQGNLITVKVNNGSLASGNSLNELYLVDGNSSLEQNATGGPVVAKLTDKVDGIGGYTLMTFKFSQQVQSGSTLFLVNNFETNATLKNNVALDYGLGYRSSTMKLNVNQGLACAENVTLEVINAKDQSSDWFNTPNTGGKSSTGVTIATGVSIKLGVDGNTATTGLGYDGFKGKNLNGDSVCPTYACTIKIAADEKAFGASLVGNSTCPTCTTTSTDYVYTCKAGFTLEYKAGSLVSPAAGIAIGSVEVKTTGAAATMGELTKITMDVNGGASTALTINSDLKNAKGTAGVALVNKHTNQKVNVTYYANGTSVLTPTTFDMEAGINGNVKVDTITNFMTFKEEGTPLHISYMSANPAYRTFARVTSDKPATIQAVVTTEDGMTSNRVNVMNANGNQVEIKGATGGAVVVLAADILKSAQDDGFTGTGARFNTVLYVKTDGVVDAVAYQTDAATNSQRYLPVGGATGSVTGTY